MTKGSCLCGAVRWELTGPLTSMSHCHCSMCRKTHGAPFVTFVDLPSDNLNWTAGKDAVRYFAGSASFARGFCNQCGSSVPDMADQMAFVPAGGLDGDPGMRPTEHIFVGSKAPWHQIADGLVQFDAWRDGETNPIIEQPSRALGGGRLGGSCLCGAVAYEVTAPIKVVHNCHCSRCRKARAAAHTTNGFTAIDGVTFSRGEDNLITYKLPSARFFTHVFCSTCGSGMPRLDPERGIAVIPFGSLDDDPGRGADDHIFIGSKAPWYTPEDDLPKFEEMPG